MDDCLYCINLGNRVLVVNVNDLRSVLLDMSQFKSIRNDPMKSNVLLADVIGESVFKPTNLSHAKINPVLLLNYNCNYNCDYCYQQEKKSITASIREEDIPLIKDYILQLCKLRNTPQCYSAITVTGGEPLLPENEQVLNRILTTWEQESIVIKTNGVNLLMYEYLYSNRDIMFHVSLDGTETMHYSKRKTQIKNAYHYTIEGIKCALSHGRLVAIATVFDPNYINEYPKFFDMLETIGWLKNEQLSLHFLPRITNGCDDIDPSYLSTSVNLLKDLRMNDKRAHHVVMSRFVPGALRFLLAISEYQQSKTYNPYRCDCLNTPSYMFSPNGQVFPCAFITDDNFSIGTYRNPAYINWDIIEKLRKRSIYEMESCQKCHKRLMCYGGCPASAIKNSGNIYDGQCGIWNSTHILNLLENMM